MTLTSIEYTPKYEHTISPDETTYIATHDNKDYYYRYNGMYHIIDVRHSNDPSDYVNWSISDYKGNVNINRQLLSVIPNFIINKASQLAKINH